jgi:alpha-glucosidase (family GH31 glycosyl hydrolase)
VIRHRPFGLGHPYRLEPDQRVPTIPIAGEAFELRATTDRAVRAVQVELELAGKRRRLSARHAAPESTVATSAAGHLAAAASGKEASDRRSWVVRPDPLPFGTGLRYRFLAKRRGRGQQTAWYSVVPARWHDEGGRLAVNSPAGDDGLAGRLIPGSLAWLIAEAGALRVRFALRLDAGDHVVGFGERFDTVDQRGKQLDAVVFEQYKQQGARTYLPMPFAIVVGRDGWGFHVATSRRTWFDVAQTDSNRLWVEVALDPDQRNPLVQVELFRGSPADVLGAFLERTGRPKLPPDWIFHPWMSGNEWNTQARVMTEVERSQREGIPAGVVVIEAWSDESTFAAFRDAKYRIHRDGAPHHLRDFRFPADGAWPDPKHMVDELHARGLKVLLWQVPLVKTHPPPTSQARCDRDVMLRRGYAVREADGRPYRNRGWWFPRALLPDFTSPQARKWWLAKRRYLVEEVGIDGFKTDGGEHAWGDDLRYADGSRGDAGNNRYPVAYAGAYHQLLAELGRDGITFSRAGFTGSAAYPCHWAGDEDSTWEAFRASITAGLTAGASGIFFWGWDLAGFSGEIPTAELYLRAAAMACFCPIMQYHSEYNHHRQPSRDRTPWNIQERTGDSRVVPIYRRFAQLREAMVPYLIEQARLAIETSRPLMRALFFEAPADPEIWNWPYQYLLGDDLLVAPVVQPGTQTWRIFLPAGKWVDAWTGSVHAGPTTVDRAVPLEEIPVYVRESKAQTLRQLFGHVGDRRNEHRSGF